MGVDDRRLASHLRRNSVDCVASNDENVEVPNLKDGKGLISNCVTTAGGPRQPSDTTPGRGHFAYRSPFTRLPKMRFGRLGAGRRIPVMLALGVWVLVLSPRSIEAHHIFAVHDCSISGTADGKVDQSGEFSIDASAFSVRCDHREPVKTF